MDDQTEINLWLARMDIEESRTRSIKANRCAQIAISVAAIALLVAIIAVLR